MLLQRRVRPDHHLHPPPRPLHSCSPRVLLLGPSHLRLPPRHGLAPETASTTSTTLVVGAPVLRPVRVQPVEVGEGRAGGARAPGEPPAAAEEESAVAEEVAVVVVVPATTTTTTTTSTPLAIKRISSTHGHGEEGNPPISLMRFFIHRYI